MARTPLLRSLISFAREHAAADARGLPVNAIREEREQAAEKRKSGGLSRRGYQATWEASRAQPGASGIFVGYCGGPFADAMKSKTAFATATSAAVRQDATRFLAQAEPVFPGLTAQWNGKAAQGLPHLDPNLQLSYSFFKVGQYQTIGAYERVTQGGVYFAGEHCSMDFQGFMEGGAIEGERAGDDILAAIGVK